MSAPTSPQHSKRHDIQEKIQPIILQKSFAELEWSVLAALETCSNVHRGSGHFSLVSTALFEHSRRIILDHLQLDHRHYSVIFCSPYRAHSEKPPRF